MGKFKSWSKAKLHELKRFIYNRNTGEILGRTPTSWGQLLLFFAIFFTLIGGFFAVHLAVFVAITPSPDSGVAPWNFGGYAYPNYPNSKTEIISIPDAIQSNGSHISFASDYNSAIDGLIEAAALSGVTCMNSSNGYGFTDGRSCVLIRMIKVFEWTPSSIQQFLPPNAPSFDDYLRISCSLLNNDTEAQGITITTVPQGIPLNIFNNEDGRSFPYQNQHNYTHPVVGVIIDTSNMTASSSLQQVTVQCGVDLDWLGINDWSSERLARIYEIPNDATITVHFNR